MNVAEARMIVLSRDGECVASKLDPKSGGCRDKWGLPLTRYSGIYGLELDRVRDAPAMGSAPGHDNPFRMVALCPFHHRGIGGRKGEVWATAHREVLREYLETVRTRTEEMIGRV